MGYLIAMSAGSPLAVTAIFVPGHGYTQSACQTAVDRINSALARAESAEAECERLREDLAALTAELDTTRSLLQGVIDGPLMWYEDICDYLETIE